MEEWKWIAGYEGRYEVSNQGRVRSFCRVNGTRYSDRKEPQVLRRYLGKNGYLYISLTDLGHKHKHCQLLLHRVMSLAFIPNPENKPYINHIDGNRANCALSNFEWVTQSENILHGISIGRLTVAKNPARGEQAHKSNLTDLDVRAIRKRHAQGGLSYSQLGREYGVADITIKRIVKRRNWTHI